MIKKNNELYYSNSHSKFLLQYHIVLITKYRHKVIKGKLKDSLILYIKKYFKDRNLNVLEINTDLDHIYILFETDPDINLKIFINALKSASSRKM